MLDATQPRAKQNLRIKECLPGSVRVSRKTLYFVATDTKQPNGGTLLDDRRSRPIDRVGILRRVLKRVRRNIPQAFGIQVRYYR